MTGPVTDSSTAAGSPESPDRVERAIRRFQEGIDREGAFRFLYETYFRAIERFFARKGLSPEDCLDLTQETFLGIYKGLDGYEHRQRFAAWLYRAASSTACSTRSAGGRCGPPWPSCPSRCATV
jgi:RNA polymerase sigma-70 factor, ECF subfamily